MFFSLIVRLLCGVPLGQRKYANYQRSFSKTTFRSMLEHWRFMQIITSCRLLMYVMKWRNHTSELFFSCKRCYGDTTHFNMNFLYYDLAIEFLCVVLKSVLKNKSTFFIYVF